MAVNGFGLPNRLFPATIERPRRYFASTTELLGTLSRVFTEMQDSPALIRPYLLPFC